MSDLAGPDGFYAAYMSAVDGQGFVMFVFKDGVIAGADPAGVHFDGTYKPIAEGFTASVLVKVPPNSEVIQGASAGSSGMTYSVELHLAQRFWELPFVPIETPLGKVNARFERVREL